MLNRIVIVILETYKVNDFKASSSVESPEKCKNESVNYNYEKQ